MKKLFIYYSHTGNGEKVKEILEKEGYEIRKVVPKKSLPKNFFMQMMVGGMLAGFKHKSKLEEFDYNVEPYDEIIIGSPIWNDRFACPINTILKNMDLNNKKLKFILYSGSGKGEHAKEYINKKYKAEIIFLKEPKKYKEELEKVV